MAYKGRIPSGYRQQDYPMIHQFEYNFSLDVEDETKNSTIVSLFKNHLMTAVETREVNPSHANFAEDAGTACFSGSIIPKLSVGFTAKMDQAAFDIDSIEHMMFKWMPIYTAFLTSLDAENNGTPASDIETILELQHNTSKKKTHPLFTGTDLMQVSGQPLSDVNDTETFTGMGLTTDDKIESVAFDEQAFWDAKSYYSNKGMLNKVTGQFHKVYLDYHRKPYTYFSNNFTNPIVKRMNSYTFCGILFHVPQAGEVQQLCDDADVTTSVGHIDIAMHVRFEEWNVDYDQTAL